MAKNKTIHTQLVYKYYQTSALFLLLTAVLTAYYSIVRLAGFSSNSSLLIGVIHLGTLGVLTFGLFGLYLRVFATISKVNLNERSLVYLYWLLVWGIIILFLGMLTINIIPLGIGAVLIIIAAFWWSILYFRWYFQAPGTDRRGALLFGLLGSIGLLFSVLLGGYMIHGYSLNEVASTARLAHIHVALIGWVSMGLLGVGVAFRGGEIPITRSIGALTTTAWGWLVGFGVLGILMLFSRFHLLLIPAIILLLGFFLYGYSMPKVGKLDNSDAGDSPAPQGILPFIILGFVGLFATILLGFDVSLNYPNGQVALHSGFAIGGWLLMMILLSLLSEIPRTAYALLKERIADSTLPDKATFYTLGGIKALWGLLLLGLLVYLAGVYMSPVLQFIGVLVLAATTAVITALLLIKYRVSGD